MTLQKVSSNKSFGGVHEQFTHHSAVLNCDMRFAVYFPSHASESAPVPVLYWLSGLTCTDENFMQKSGVQRMAAKLGMAIVAPDTSPRGNDIPNDEAYDLGQGAGFYVNATQSPWAAHFKMYDYITKELPELIESNFPVSDRRAISGHSMGGHGALMIGLKNPERYRSISAFSPIANPVDCPWGRKAFTAYLGSNEQEWQQYDSSLLMSIAEKGVPTKVDLGASDEFLSEQLKPESLQQAAQTSNYPLELNIHIGYDHSYYFVATFIDEHLSFHAEYLFDK